MIPLLLALALAAPERVVVVARPAERPSFFARLGQGLRAAARRLYERDDGDVTRGNALLAQDDAQGALAEYDKAKQRLPDDPGVAYDRATALLKIDPRTAPEAVSEAGRAVQRADAALKPKAAYQMALALESLGQADDAVRQYAAALALDPDDTDSKVNLELLLRSEERNRRSPTGQPKQDQAAQQGDQKPKPQQGQAEDKQRASPTQKQSQGQQQQPDQQDPSRQDQTAAGEQQKPQPRPEPGAGAEKPVDRTEAQRLLDALRASEKNLQIWRFAKRQTDLRKRSDVDKDW